jgi:hypothetical protein
MPKDVIVVSYTTLFAILVFLILSLIAFATFTIIVCQFILYREVQSIRSAQSLSDHRCPRRVHRHTHDAVFIERTRIEA